MSINIDVLSFLSKGLDKIVPDAAQREELKLRAIQLQQAGEFKELDAAMSAILAEANSADKWTSRARPAFLYVMYTFILAAIPMGVLFAYDPMIAGNVTLGVGDWLNAIPDKYVDLFGLGYLGYVGGRSWDKHSKNKHGDKS